MAYIEVDIDEYLSEVDTETLRLELNSRRDASPKDDPAGLHQWTPAGLSDDLRTAFYARNASRFEALLCVLQPHEATPGLKRVKVPA